MRTDGRSAIGYLTHRRELLDRAISRFRLEGLVADIGGEKVARRGTFAPDLSYLQRMLTINIDAASRPELRCSASRLALVSDSVDTVLCTEVLEHLDDPEAAVAECCRILKPGGRFYGSMPFLFAIHGDPHDYQRWTPTRLHDVFSRSGFASVQIEPLGGVWSVVWDLFHVALSERGCQRPRSLRNRGLRVILRCLRPVFLFLDGGAVATRRLVTTGYVISALKPSEAP